MRDLNNHYASTSNLKPWVYYFIQEYISNNCTNASKALAKVKPNLAPRSTRTISSLLLANKKIKEHIEIELQKRNVAAISSRDQIMQEFEQVRKAALEKGELKTSLTASKEKAQLAGHYIQKKSATDDFMAFMGSLSQGSKQVNVQINNGVMPGAKALEEPKE